MDTYLFMGKDYWLLCWLYMLPLHNKLLVLIATDFGVKTSLSNKSLTLAAIYPTFILKVGLFYVQLK